MVLVSQRVQQPMVKNSTPIWFILTHSYFLIAMINEMTRMMIPAITSERDSATG